MVIITKRLRKRPALAALLTLCVLLVLLLGLRGCGKRRAQAPGIPAETNEQRVAYLASLGWEVSPEPIETLSITLGETLAEPYLSYNTLQLPQGFDLTRCCGKTLSRYTYVVTNYPDETLPCQADLYVCEGLIAAGDIVCTGENGFMAGLTFPAA